VARATSTRNRRGVKARMAKKKAKKARPKKK